MIAKEILEQLFNLPADERRQLGEELLDSVENEEDLSPELKAELDRAIEEHQRNPNEGIPMDEFIAQMRAREKK